MTELAADQAVESRRPAPGEVDARLEAHRIELTAYCYRMLGSAFEAEDAVQDTMVRAWKSIERFEGRSSLRSWLYKIATNVCFDMLDGRQRRALPMDMGPAQPADPALLGSPLPEVTWLQPVPDSRVVPADGDPAEVAELRETIRLAFVATLQHLPPRQRAVLILREVLQWPAADVADLLGTTIASVNSALQRARATLAANDVTSFDEAKPLDDAQRHLLDRYVDAFERYDMNALTELLTEDASWSMPPYALWLQTHDDIRASAARALGWCRSRPTARRRSPSTSRTRTAVTKRGRCRCSRSTTTGSPASCSSWTSRPSTRCSGCRCGCRPDARQLVSRLPRPPVAGHRPAARRVRSAVGVPGASQAA